MKIVFDTTILVLAHEHAHGLGRKLLLTAIESNHELLISNEMLQELARVLRYPRLQSFYDLTEDLVFDYVKFLRRVSETLTLNPLVMAPIRDINDVIVLQTAIIGEADVIRTNDEDFFSTPAVEYLKELGIEVLSDIDLLHRLGS